MAERTIPKSSTPLLRIVDPEHRLCGATGRLVSEGDGWLLLRMTATGAIVGVRPEQVIRDDAGPLSARLARRRLREQRERGAA